MNTESGYQFLIAFEKMSIPNCKISKLHLTHLDQNPGTYCERSQAPQIALSKNSQLNLTWQNKQSTGAEKTNLIEFAMIVTATSGKAIQCNKNEFQCGMGYCIDSLLNCDGYNNCGDGSDEKICESAERS